LSETASQRDRAVARLVHDLSTPVTVIAGFAELLAGRGDDLSREQRDEYVARIAEAAREARGILDAHRPRPQRP
jgi:signal transduction histidine kinase